MNEPLCNVMFDGTVDASRNVDEVKKNVAALFKKEPSQIEALFFGRPVALKKNVDPATAEKYRQALLKAGAICTIVSTAPVDDGSPSVPVVDEAAAAPSMTVITPAETGGTAQFPALTASFISSAFGGINLNRMDMAAVPMADLIFLSVFTEIAPKGNSDKLILFIRGFARPFITEVGRIRFREFPGVAALTIPESLKKFIMFLYEQNPALAVDADTYEFLGGRKRLAEVRDVPRYINLIGRALTANQTLNMAAPARPVAVGQTLPPPAPPVQTPVQTAGQTFVPAVAQVPISAPVPAPGLPPLQEPAPAPGDYAVRPPALSAAPASPAAPTLGEGLTAEADQANRYFVEAQEMLSEGDFQEGMKTLEKSVALKPDYWEAHHLIATRLMMLKDAASADAGLTPEEKKEKVLFHAQKAFEHADRGEIEVAITLSKALAENGNPDKGLSVLEEIYADARDDKIKNKLEKEIDEFRLDRDLGRLWQFFDRQGKVVYESTDIFQIRDKLVDGSLTLEMVCQKNRAGARQSVMALLVAEEPDVEILVNPVMFHIKNGAQIGGLISGVPVGLWYVGKFLIYYIKALPESFSEFVRLGLQNIVAFVAAIVLLGLPSLLLGLILLGIVIGVIAVATGALGAIPGAISGGFIGFIVGVIRAPFLPKIGSGAKPGRR